MRNVSVFRENEMLLLPFKLVISLLIPILLLSFIILEVTYAPSTFLSTPPNDYAGPPG